jgi:hypothetical protein
MSVSKLIRIDTAVYAALKAKAKGFETPNAVIRRLLGLPPVVRGRAKPA